MDRSDMRQRFVPRALREDYSGLTYRERVAKLYRENPPDFTVKKEVLNRFGVTYFLLMSIIQLYLLGWVIIPHVGDGQTLIYWKLLSCFMFVQCYYNWFQCCRKYVNKAERRPEDSDKTNGVGWRLCAICQYDAPPRSHHCKLCKACMLRQDHHCYFAAGCIGQFTTAYFVFLCVWLVVSQSVLLYWSGLYCATEFTSGWMYFPPTAFLASLNNSQSWFNFFLLFVMVCALIDLLAALLFLFLSAYAASGNVTFYEGSRGIRRYKKDSVLANVRAAWGSYYWIRWLVPFYSAPEGDGYNWEISTREE
ncbi:probable palmitoyltransferase ZDHHC24 [Watersipora subatra]|uniref:probable palmitoyltransferase ZDHHC24 n=1 Tax=Watersipora subatra TaxID=2589382 RepID=UPI00355B732D